MAKAAILAIRIVGDATKASKTFDDTGREVGKFESGVRKAQVGAGLALGAIAAGAKVAGESASRLQQAGGAVGSVFGAQAPKIDAFAKKAAGSVGLAQSEYAEMASVLGAQLGNMGVAQDKLVGSTDGLIKKGADLAATFGGTTSDAVGALSALMRGETDPIERYGVSIKDADIKARLAAKGQAELTGAAAKTARTQAILDLLNQQTAKSTGQFARETGSAAGAQQIANAKMENAKAQLGTFLLPIMAKASGVLATMAGHVSGNAKAYAILTGVIATVATAVFAVNGALTAYRATTAAVTTVIKAAKIAQTAWNASMFANPIGIIVLAVVAAVAAVVLLYKRSDAFRKFADGAFKAVGVAIGKTGDALKAVGRFLGGAFMAYLRTYKTAALFAWGAVTGAVGKVRAGIAAVATWTKDKVVGAFTSAKAKGKAAWEALTRPIYAVRDAIASVVGWIQSINWPKPPSWLSKGLSMLGVPSPFSASRSAISAMSVATPGVRMASATTDMSAPSVASTTSSTSSSTPAAAPVQIVVQGALDPDAVARQIEKILSRRGVRIGRVA